MSYGNVTEKSSAKTIFAKGARKTVRRMRPYAKKMAGAD